MASPTIAGNREPARNYDAGVYQHHHGVRSFRRQQPTSTATTKPAAVYFRDIGRAAVAGFWHLHAQWRPHHRPNCSTKHWEWRVKCPDEWRSLKQERTQHISRWYQQRGTHPVTIYTQRGPQKPLTTKIFRATFRHRPHGYRGNTRALSTWENRTRGV